MLPLGRPIDPRDCLIYAIRNKANRHCYVGSTVQTCRYSQHIRQLDRDKHHCTPLQRAWVKYGGKKAFEWIILENLGPVSGIDRDLGEIRWIVTHGYYNLVRASQDARNFTHSEETGIKISQNLSEALKDPIHRETKRQRALEMWQDPETREQILLSLSRNFEDPKFMAWWLSRVHSKEADAKNSAAIKDKWANDSVYREKLVNAAKEERATPQAKERMRKQTLKNFKDPEICEKHRIATKAAWQDPDIYARRVAAFRTDEAVKNRSNAAVDGWVKRKLRKNLNILAQAKASVEACTKSIENSGTL